MSVSTFSGEDQISIQYRYILSIAIFLVIVEIFMLAVKKPYKN
jgi:hypothetical protein